MNVLSFARQRPDAYRLCVFIVVFFKDTATTEIYALSLHDALPISRARWRPSPPRSRRRRRSWSTGWSARPLRAGATSRRDRKSTRLNSSHANISYAVFCLKKKKTIHTILSCILRLLLSLRLFSHLT